MCDLVRYLQILCVPGTNTLMHRTRSLTPFGLSISMKSCLERCLGVCSPTYHSACPRSTNHDCVKHLSSAALEKGILGWVKAPSGGMLGIFSRFWQPTSAHSYHGILPYSSRQLCLHDILLTSFGQGFSRAIYASNSVFKVTPGSAPFKEPDFDRTGKDRFTLCYMRNILLI